MNQPITEKNENQCYRLLIPIHQLIPLFKTFKKEVDLMDFHSNLQSLSTKYVYGNNLVKNGQN